MNRKKRFPLRPPAVTQEAAPSYPPAQHISMSVPRGFREAMEYISGRMADNSSVGAEKAAHTKLASKPAASAPKWKSSFKVGDGEDGLQEESTGSQERNELYDPFNPDDEHDKPQEQDHYRVSANQDAEHQQSNSRWDRHYSQTQSHASNCHDLSHKMQPIDSQDHRLPETAVHSPDFESTVPPSYGSSGRPPHHRLSSPQMFPSAYGVQGTNEENLSIPEYRREMTTTDRLSPPRLKRDYQHHSGNNETGLHTADVTNRRTVLLMDNVPISCDLCDVELANGQELQDHLESMSHWDTLEHIQKQSNYNDVTIAFLQEVMLCKSRECSRAIEDSLLQALQENDHMTKVEVFHCAACSVYLSTSASVVHSHLTSQEHLSNTKEFKVQQRRSCLDKAETIIQKLKPHFENFLQGGSPFE